MDDLRISAEYLPGAHRNCGYDISDPDNWIQGCEACADFSPMAAEMVAQARLIANAKHEAVEQEFINQILAMLVGL